MKPDDLDRLIIEKWPSKQTQPAIYLKPETLKRLKAKQQDENMKEKSTLQSFRS